MNVKRLTLAFNISSIATELEKVESDIVSFSACINGDSTPYLKKKMLEKLNNRINQRADLISDLNEAVVNYIEYVESLKS